MLKIIYTLVEVAEIDSPNRAAEGVEMKGSEFSITTGNF